MSALLSADDLNDFISPGVACIKPVETLPLLAPGENDTSNDYEVTTEDRVAGRNAAPASISLTDCLACSGCVTSAEAVLVSLQSHAEVLDVLDRYAELPLWGGEDGQDGQDGHHVQNGQHGRNGQNGSPTSDVAEGKIFVASVSPQTRASLAATYNVTEREAGHMIAQLLSGPHGLRAGGKHNSAFTWIVDTNAMRQACLVAAADEVSQHLSSHPTPKTPILTSACPGWICYAEKTHPHILPHLSALKSPQALAGTLLKSVLAARLHLRPDQIWHLAIMPCFDKKLEASRAELTSAAWDATDGAPSRDVDCVITARELLMLAESRHIAFPRLPPTPLRPPPFPDPELDAFLFARHKSAPCSRAAGTSGGYLWHVLQTVRAAHAPASIAVQRGRNADVCEYVVVGADGRVVFSAARVYGFRNIQNLVRRLKPARAERRGGRPGARGAGAVAEYAYVEVMACPGGCTNGGGQIRVGDVATLRQGLRFGGVGVGDVVPAPPLQKEWLGAVDEAYWSADSEETGPGVEGQDGAEGVDEVDRDAVRCVLARWSAVAGVPLERLMRTTYRRVQSNVGRSVGDAERVAGLAVAVGGGW